MIPSVELKRIFPFWIMYYPLFLDYVCGLCLILCLTIVVSSFMYYP